MQFRLTLHFFRTTFLLFLSLSPKPNHAFSVTSSFRTTTVQSRLFGMTRHYNNNDDSYYSPDDLPFDVEEARKKLESLVTTENLSVEDKKQQQQQQQHPLTSALFSGPSVSSVQQQQQQQDHLPKSSSSLEDIELPPAPPLTTIERERRMAEMQLLSQLEHGDEALGDLWTLWFQERGAEAQARLLQAEELTGMGPASWDEAEEVLCDLIDVYGVYWAEPVNRLATLYYMQGNLDQAEALCKIVLAVKPWHFGALSGLVMVYAGQHNVEEARRWAARRLPVYASEGSNRRRLEWVQKAVANAQDSLQTAERRLKEMFGPRDKLFRISNDFQQNTNNQDGTLDAWQ